MSRHYRHSGHQTLRRQPTATKEQYASAQKHLCFALHSIPEPSFLDQLSYYDVGKYSPSWAKPKLTNVEKGNTCIAYLLPRTISLLPLPSLIASEDAPYAIAYDFALQQTCEDGEHYSPIARYYGFTIATLPSHDWRRALSFSALGDYNSALSYADRALVSLATARPSGITPSVEKAASRFSKLTNLFIDEPSQPEGQLAAQRAMQSALKCLAELSEGRIG